MENFSTEEKKLGTGELSGRPDEMLGGGGGEGGGVT